MFLVKTSFLFTTLVAVAGEGFIEGILSCIPGYI
jgi:hypothetical protein